MPLGFDMDKIREEQERQIAAAHERRARFFSFLRDLQPSQLGTLMDMLSLCDTKNGRKFLHHQIGVISTLQTVIHGCCGCGEDHDEAIIREEKDLLESEREAENNKATMIEYGLIRKDDGKLYCKGCGQGYVSLDDRMLRSPGPAGCGSCQQKAKWG